MLPANGRRRWCMCVRSPVRQVRIQPLHNGCDRRYRAREIACSSQVEVHPAEPLVLSIRHEELRRDRLLHVAVLRILDDSDDRRVELAAVAFSRGPSHQLADGVVPEAELLCERLVDEGNLRGVHRVGIGELASGNEGDAKRGEVAGTDSVVAGAGWPCLRRAPPIVRAAGSRCWRRR